LSFSGIFCIIESAKWPSMTCAFRFQDPGKLV
jgi:hypothetical protein